VTYYHMTSIYHLPVILESRYLKVVESNVDLNPANEHAGPDVVWVTTSPRPHQGWAEMLRPEHDHIDKCRIIIEVDPPAADVHAWWDWSTAHGATDHHKWALAVSGTVTIRGGRKREPELEQRLLAAARAEWHVIERRVPWQEWVRITDQLSGQIIWQRDEAQLAGGFRMPRLFQPRLVSKAEERAYFDRVAPSVNIARDLGLL